MDAIEVGSDHLDFLIIRITKTLYLICFFRLTKMVLESLNYKYLTETEMSKLKSYKILIN